MDMGRGLLRRRRRSGSVRELRDRRSPKRCCLSRAGSRRSSSVRAALSCITSSRVRFGGIALGNDPTVHHDGFGTLVKPGTTIRWNMHYHKEPGPGTGTWDRSSVALRFYPKDYKPELRDAEQVDGQVRLRDTSRPTRTTSPRRTATFERDALLLGYTPHMHLRGKSAHYLARYPDGTEEVLLDVPRYDFNWQTHYKYHGGRQEDSGGDGDRADDVRGTTRRTIRRIPIRPRPSSTAAPRRPR